MKIAETSRRTFIGGAASTAAVLGPLAIVSGSAPKGRDAARRTVTSPTPLGGKDGSTSEVDRWSTLVGQRFVIASAATTQGAVLALAKPGVSIGARPKILRQQPLALTFRLDAPLAAGDAIFRVMTAAGIDTLLFMQPGQDSTGAARLTALLN